jgi:hypothetical protein
MNFMPVCCTSFLNNGKKNPMNFKQLNAIVVDPAGFKKYHKVATTDGKTAKFERFVLNRFPQVTHINYYHCHNREFSHQVRYTPPASPSNK